MHPHRRPRGKRRILTIDGLLRAKLRVGYPRRPCRVPTHQELLMNLGDLCWIKATAIGTRLRSLLRVRALTFCRQWYPSRWAAGKTARARSSSWSCASVRRRGGLMTVVVAGLQHHQRSGQRPIVQAHGTSAPRWNGARWSEMPRRDGPRPAQPQSGLLDAAHGHDARRGRGHLRRSPRHFCCH